MQSKLVLIDRQALQAELQEVFDARTVKTLLSVLDKVVAQVHAAGVTREDFSELKQIVAELAEAQRRTEQRVAELAEAQRRSEERLSRLEETVAALAEAQRRTEQRVAELAEAQRRSEERLSRLEETVAALAEAQRRSEERLSRLEETVVALAEAQRRSEERLSRLEETVAALAEAQRRSEERLSRLEETVAALAEAQRRSEERLSRLEERLSSVEERLSGVEERLNKLETSLLTLAEQVRQLVASQQKIVDDLGGLKGRVLELTYRGKAGAYFGPLLRRLRVVSPHTLEDVLEARLSPEGFKDVLLLDLLVSGQPRHLTQAPEVWLAVEVSSVVDEEDVTRARRRAELLRQAGYCAVPAVAGERITLGAEDEARQHRVVVLQDGRSFLWDEALAAWVA